MFIFITMKSTDLNRLQKEVCNNPFFITRSFVFYIVVFVVVNRGQSADSKTKFVGELIIKSLKAKKMTKLELKLLLPHRSTY